MAELKRKDEELTTADLAGRSERSRQPEDGPQLMRNEPRDQTERPPVPMPPKGTDTRDTRLTREGPSSAAEIATRGSLGGPAQAGSMAGVDSGQPTPLFSESEVGDFRSRWGNVQAGFVDEPRRAVEDADNLVASLMKKLAEGFANERARLEQQWDSGDNVSTEDLRLALQRYRSFFDRLLKV